MLLRAYVKCVEIDAHLHMELNNNIIMDSWYPFQDTNF